MKIEKTGYNYRTRKERDIMAFIYDANGEMLDAIHPGTGNHRTALDWATWRSNTIREDYPAANTMLIHCGDDEIAAITLDNNNNTDNTTPTTSDTMNTETITMNTTELINSVSAHLRNIVEQSYTVCAVNLTAPIVNAGAALGIVICGGAYDPDTETRVLYTEKC